MKFIKSTNFRRHVVFLEQTHVVSGFENMTSLSASCWIVIENTIAILQNTIAIQQEALSDVIF